MQRDKNQYKKNHELLKYAAVKIVEERKEFKRLTHAIYIQLIEKLAEKNPAFQGLMAGINYFGGYR